MKPEWFENFTMKDDWENIISSVLNVSKSSVIVTKNQYPVKVLRLLRQLNGLNLRQVNGNRTSLIVLISTNDNGLMTIINSLISDEFKMDMNIEIMNYWKFEVLPNMTLQAVKPMTGN